MSRALSNRRIFTAYFASENRPDGEAAATPKNPNDRGWGVRKDRGIKKGGHRGRLWVLQGNRLTLHQ